LQPVSEPATGPNLAIFPWSLTGPFLSPSPAISMAVNRTDRAAFNSIGTLIMAAARSQAMELTAMKKLMSFSVALFSLLYMQLSMAAEPELAQQDQAARQERLARMQELRQLNREEQQYRREEIRRRLESLTDEQRQAVQQRRRYRENQEFNQQQRQRRREFMQHRWQSLTEVQLQQLRARRDGAVAEDGDQPQ
jgi:hypothetical protein